jgi:haloalkane dehalogenase
VGVIRGHDDLWMAGYLPTHRDAAVAGSSMHYVEAGAGRPVVFLHGNPTSSYLWRDVLPAVHRHGRRLIAVDLIGMGASGKPTIGYRLTDHIDHLAALLDALTLDDVIFVAHDWGVAICLEYLRRHPDRVAAVAFMEGHLRPLAGWDAFDPGGRAVFQQLRTAGAGERMVLEENFFIETVLASATLRPLSPADLDEYRRPYPDPQARRPLLQWAREIPIGGQPAGSAKILADAWDNLCISPVPKLLVHGRPGAVVTAATVAMCRSTIANLSVADVGEAGHFLPEDRPAAVAAALSAWIDSLPKAVAGGS